MSVAGPGSHRVRDEPNRFKDTELRGNYAGRSLTRRPSAKSQVVLAADARNLLAERLVATSGHSPPSPSVEAFDLCRSVRGSYSPLTGW